MKTTPRTTSSLEARIEAIEASLKRLEQRPAARLDAALDPRRYWLLEELVRRSSRERSGKSGGGLVGYGGALDMPDGSHYRWQGENRAANLLAASWNESAAAFAALGHPVRLELLRAILLGMHEVAELQRRPGMGTSGQVYHHLRELQAAGWVRQQHRNRYVVVPDRLVCVLIMVGAVVGPEDTSAAPKRAASPRRAK